MSFIMHITHLIEAAGLSQLAEADAVVAGASAGAAAGGVVVAAATEPRGLGRAWPAVPASGATSWRYLHRSPVVQRPYK